MLLGPSLPLPLYQSSCGSLFSFLSLHFRYCSRHRSSSASGVRSCLPLPPAKEPLHALAFSSEVTDEESIPIDKIFQGMAPMNEKGCNSNLPDDLVLIILSKLPLKSLKRFACVKKSWLRLFDNPRFMSMFFRNFISNCPYDDNSCLLLKKNRPHELICVSGERFGDKVSLPLQHIGDRYFYFLGFVNGIHGTVCIHVPDGEIKTLLWNPATGESLIIPPSPFNSIPIPRSLNYVTKQFGVGYDHISGDYKLIQFSFFLGFNTFDETCWDDRPEKYPDDTWEIYSVTSNTWRKLDVNMPPPIDSGGVVYLNGVYHWISSPKTFEMFLVSFDLSNKVFFTTPFPSHLNEFSIQNPLADVHCHLAELNGSIALISYRIPEDAFLDISILGKLGVMESWTKLFTFGPLPCYRNHVGAGKKGEIFYFKDDNQLACIDMSTQMIEEMGVDAGSDSYSCQLMIYKESFLPIRENNN